MPDDCPDCDALGEMLEQVIVAATAQKVDLELELTSSREDVAILQHEISGHAALVADLQRKTKVAQEDAYFAHEALDGLRAGLAPLEGHPFVGGIVRRLLAAGRDRAASAEEPTVEEMGEPVPTEAFRHLRHDTGGNPPPAVLLDVPRDDDHLGRPWVDGRCVSIDDRCVLPEGHDGDHKISGGGGSGASPEPLATPVPRVDGSIPSSTSSGAPAAVPVEGKP